MREDKVIYLFTTAFPYGKGEQFLETEIGYLSQRFKHIYILPNVIMGGKRPLNFENITILCGLANRNKISKFKKLLSVLIMKKFWLNFRFNLNYLKLLIIHVYYVKIIYVWYRSYFNGGIEINENCLFYTYWFNEQTTGLAFLKKKISNLVIISRAHGSDLYEKVHGIREFPFRKEVLLKVNMIFSISSSGEEHLKSRYGVTNVSTSRLGTSNSIPFKSNIEMDTNIKIISCSSISRNKRVDLIGKALSLVENSNYSFKWCHIGSGELFDEVKNSIKKVNSGTNVDIKFLGDLSNSDVMKFYSENYFDVFVNVSESEGIPVSIMEAQSWGIPTIATNVGGVKEIVNTSCGILLEKHFRTEELLEAILKLSSKSRTNSIFRKAAYENWITNYNSEINYNLFIDQILLLHNEKN
jgi:glycosyltransferase involved in cell wall biosynthesis